MKLLNFLTWYHPKKLKDTLFPVSVINWIFGLNILEIPVGHPRPSLSLIYIMTVIVIYYYNLLTYGISVCGSRRKQNNGQTLFDFIWFYNALAGLIFITVSWHYQKVVPLCIQRIELINVSLGYFGLGNNHGKIFARLVLTIIIGLSGSLFVVVSDFFCHLAEKTLKQSIYCTYLECPVLLQIIIDLGFVTMVSTIGYSFENINALLEKGTNKNLVLEKAFLNRKSFKISTLILPVEFNFRSPDKSRNFIQIIKHQHLELSKVAQEVDKIFGLQIAMSMVTCMTLIIGNSYTLFNTIFKSDIEERQDISVMFIINGISSCLLHILRVLFVNGTCANVTAEARKAEEFIFYSSRNNPDADLRKEIEQFSLQLSQQPLFFSMYGLTRLDYGFVAKFLGAVITYLIIVIQIEPNPKVNIKSNITIEIYTSLTTQMT